MHGEILEIIPVSVYQDRVFTQDVRVRLDDGTELRIFDPRKMCSQTFVGSDVDLEFYINSFSSVTHTNDRKYGIFPVTKHQESCADICGEFKGTHEQDNGYQSLIVVNEEEIKIDLGEYQKTKIGKFQSGDMICIKGAKLHLKDVYLNK